MIAMVIWVVLMMFWLLGNGYYAYGGPTPNHVGFFIQGLIPWACVLILGLYQFGMFRNPPPPPSA